MLGTGGSSKGLVNKKNVIDIVRLFDPDDNFKIKVDEIFALADPYNKDFVTYSMLVNAVDNIKVTVGDEEISILELIRQLKKE